MPISLKKAYSACLWLAERKLGIPVEEQRGEWDLEAKDKAFHWKREELVTALPYEYYENNTLYSYYDDEDNVCIDASNFIDGHLFADENDNEFYRYSPNRNRQFFHPMRDEVSDIHHESNESLPWKELPQLTLEELTSTSCNDNDKSDLTICTAHLTLMELLQSGQISAKGFAHFPHTRETITSESNQHMLAVELPPIYWHSNPIPNYELSAVEEGLQRHMAMISYFDKAPFKPDWDLLSISEYWYVDIEVSDSFTSWLMDRVRAEFPIPRKATFKPEGKNFLVQFGTDKSTTVRNSKGMSLLYKILKEYRKSSYSIGSGYSAEEIAADSQFDIGMNTKKPNSKHGYEEKLRNQFFDLLCRCFETEDPGEKEKLVSIAVKSLSELNKSNEDDVLTTDNLKIILSQDIDWFEANHDSLKQMLKVDEVEETKEIDSLRKNLENALDKLKVSCPHFAYYLGSLASKKTLGLGYSKENEEFYFICDDDIQWDFG
ncbi:hypothetical protein J7I06_003986 [Vibrio vulnificus]|uniref:hypothetical protein n=1 Tax=Vibrio vulnificus TaxID=672 RepID=UPI000CD1F8B9|nr:hypothetical protein [Vibrio vulnificus]EHH0804584.1 hypothetical protein [Vibrio vulnificus]POC15119.1 hypothetical protein CRN42_22450 [Vibrio vulnificus]